MAILKDIRAAAEQVGNRIGSFLNNNLKEAAIFALPTVTAFSLLPPRSAIPISLSSAVAGITHRAFRDGGNEGAIAGAASFGGIVLYSSLLASQGMMEHRYLPTDQLVCQKVSILQEEQSHYQPGQSFSFQREDGKVYTVKIVDDEYLPQGRRMDLEVSAPTPALFSKKGTTATVRHYSSGPRYSWELD